VVAPLVEGGRGPRGVALSAGRPGSPVSRAVNSVRWGMQSRPARPTGVPRVRPEVHVERDEAASVPGPSDVYLPSHRFDAFRQPSVKFVAAGTQNRQRSSRRRANHAEHVPTEARPAGRCAERHANARPAGGSTSLPARRQASQRSRGAERVRRGPTRSRRGHHNPSRRLDGGHRVCETDSKEESL
jgi:hypothetical protein